jgi:hypothetical protein
MLSRHLSLHLPAGNGHLVVATTSQCLVYSSSSWNTPTTSDLQDEVSAILTCARSFLLVQPGTGGSAPPLPDLPLTIGHPSLLLIRHATYSTW